MTTAKTKNKLLLPKNWRTTLAPRVSQLPVLGLSAAFEVAEGILKDRSNVDVQNMADSLLQSIAAGLCKVSGESNSATTSTAIDPRDIYCLYASSFSAPPRSASIIESLAIGTLSALDRACDAMDVAKSKASWHEATRALAAACAFGEWIYMMSMQVSGAPVLGMPYPKQEVRALVKAKIKKSKSAAAKKGARKSQKPNKELVFAYYEQHKSEFKSLAHAAEKASGAKLYPESKYSTIYTWLRLYVKKMKAQQ